MTQPTLLILHPDADLAQCLADLLPHGPDLAHDAAEAQRLLAQGKADILILDDSGLENGMLPGWMSALPFLPAILLLTEAGKPVCAGVSEQLVKPFRRRDLLASIQLLAKARITSAITFHEGVVLDPAERLLLVNGKEPVSLTEKEAALLLALHQAGEGGIDRQALLEEVWGYGANIDTHTLETHIYRLRGKLKQALGGGEHIVTTDNGYRIDFI